MAVTKVLNIGDCGNGYHGKHLKAAIDYIKNEEKTDGGRLVGGINCQPDFAYDKMKNTKVKFGKIDKRQAYHFIISFEEDNIDDDTAFKITERFAKEVMEQVNTPQPEIANIPELQSEEIQQTVALPAKKEIAKSTPIAQSKSIPDSVVFEVVEVMPEFPGGQQALMQYLAKNIKYPVTAHENGKQGRVIVSFVVKKDGNISDIKVARSVDPYLDKEAVRVIAAMPQWKPGKQRGENVNVRFSVPVMFRLQGPAPSKGKEIKQADLEEVVVVAYGPKEDSNANATDAKSGTALKVAEVMPKFPGGIPGLMQYLARNIKYPTIAQKNKEQGRVILQMIVGKDGSISNIKVLRSISPLLDAEAIRVVSTMPKWEPGQQGGQAIAVEYTLPIVFKLQ